MSTESDVVFQRLKAWLLRKMPTASIKKIPALNATLSSDIGYQRSQNQDRVAMARGHDFSGNAYILIAISDGMGGMIDGELCAATAIAGFFSSFFRNSSSFGMPNDWLNSATLSANKEVYKLHNGRGGATLSATLLRADGKIHYVNVGDSRIYSQHSYHIEQITTDDTIAAQMGDVAPGLANRHELLQYIGIGEALEPHIIKSEIHDATSIIMTTDGVHYLGNEVMERIAIVASDPSTTTKRLIDVAKFLGGHDNCTAAVIAIPPQADAFVTDSTGVIELWDHNGEIQLIPVAHSKSTPNEKPISQEQIISAEVEPKNKDGKSNPVRIKRSRRPPIKKAIKDLLGDEIESKAASKKENEDPKFTMTFNLREK
ncbi:PP2C family protein-serine/threonine phosphatase [Aquipseudomonas ullengensis]|uniref:Serine/threonine-protein phosphatase n=1 Tax=Aquipseudomonas ullengensis TaxID=2759166 RepID=A0A7W4LJT6_9GAMM|nr:PP2C family serine/threonine-protein phosphatase [Pseudomonas ullengensis]MBB2494479.1 serine/threonine-protein phosphatase [Pseudomonas ullengensis]